MFEKKIIMATKTAAHIHVIIIGRVVLPFIFPPQCSQYLLFASLLNPHLVHSIYEGFLAFSRATLNSVAVLYRFVGSYKHAFNTTCAILRPASTGTGKGSPLNRLFIASSCIENEISCTF